MVVEELADLEDERGDGTQDERGDGTQDERVEQLVHE